MVVHAVYFEAGIAGIAPENTCHTQLMGCLECFGNLLELAVAFRTAPIDCCPDGYRTHVPGRFDGAEEGLVIPVRQAEEFVMIDLYDEGDSVGIFTGHDVKYPKSGRDGVTTGFDRQLDDVLGVKIDRVGREGSTCAMFDPLVDGEDRQIAGVGQPAVADQDLDASQYLVVATGVHPDLFYVVRRREGADS